VFFYFFEQGMPLLREDKKQLAKQYLKQMDGATNVVILSHAGIPVNEMNAVRMDIVEANGVLKSVKKRVLLKAAEGSYDGLTLDAVDGSVMVIYSHNEEDQHAPLKVIAKHKKAWKKAKHEFGFDFV
jgi:ribosomal protein L10